MQPLNYANQPQKTNFKSDGNRNRSYVGYEQFLQNVCPLNSVKPPNVDEPGDVRSLHVL